MKERLFAAGFALFAVLTAWAQPKIDVDKTVHHFGQILWKQPVSVEYKITNRGDRPLLMYRVEASCACSVVQWNESSIMPGEQGRIKVTFDAKALGHFEKTVSIHSNASPATLHLKFVGEVVTEVKEYANDFPFTMGDIRLDREDFDFADARRGDKPTLVLTIANLSARPYRPVLMHLPSYLSMKATPSILMKGQQGKVELTLNTNLLPDWGLTQTSVYLARHEGDKVGEDNELPVSAVLLPDMSKLSYSDSLNAPRLRLSQTEVDFASILQHKEKAGQYIVLTNEGRTPLKVNKLQVFNSALEVSLKKATIAPGKSTKLKITVRKHEQGEKRRRLRILLITNDPNRPKVTINVKR